MYKLVSRIRRNSNGHGDKQSVSLRYSLVIHSLEEHAVEFRALLRSEVLGLARAFLDEYNVNHNAQLLTIRKIRTVYKRLDIFIHHLKL